MDVVSGVDQKAGEQAEVVALDRIHVDNSVQARARIEPALVDQYVEAMRDGDILPPLTVFNDGEKYILADGFHRYQAADRIGQSQFACNVVVGGLRDAILFAAGANATHGRQRSHEDKCRAVRKLLNDAEWCEWADREIARLCHVSHQLVAKLRRATGRATSEVKYRNKSGTITKMNAGKIGQNQKGKAQIPPAPLADPLNDETRTGEVAIDGRDHVCTEENVGHNKAVAVLGDFAKFIVGRITREGEKTCITVTAEDVDQFELLLGRVRLVLSVTDAVADV